ncbi:hypothetical protein ACFWXE_23875 [[Kitasatospora] papulosa]|uniref:hypothetical protein n=1 Tax=[Kitasatospora] papulosa TaxID=1464011 RepID=UPI00368AB280
MLSPLAWDRYQTTMRLPDTPAVPTRQNWQISDAGVGRTYTVHGYATARHPMYDLYETTGGVSVRPVDRITQLHSLMRARLLIAKLTRPRFTAHWAAWETALMIGEGIDLATAPVDQRGSWRFTFDFALDPEHEGYEYTAHGTLLGAAFQASADFLTDQEVNESCGPENGILDIVLGDYSRL